MYNQLRKRLLEFEARGVRLGWRVLGVRKTNAPFVFRGTFILESSSVYWPWTMSFDHAHGSINPTSPLLNFDPPWLACKPYSCQVCYSSTHAPYECPLTAIRLGGVLLVSHTSHEAMLNKKPVERLIVIDRSMLPKKVPQDPGVSSRSPPPSGGGPLPTIHESRDFVESIASFLALKLHKHIGYGDKQVPISIIRRAAECGSLSGSIAMVSDFIPVVSSWEFSSVNEEFISWMEGTLIPGSASSVSDSEMSYIWGDAPVEEPSESAPPWWSMPPFPVCIL